LACQIEGHALFCIIAVAVGEVGVKNEMAGTQWLTDRDKVIYEVLKFFVGQQTVW